VDVYVKLSKVGRNVMLAICDAELLGRTLRQDRIIFQIKDEFYNGGKTTVEEAVAMIKNSNIVNMVGCKCVERAIQKGYVHPEAVLQIEGVPHAQIVKL
jgi:hypothetical protein